jgi:hypothetical protein
VSLDGIRVAIDSAPRSDAATFARQTRNAIARAVLAASLSHEPPGPPEHAPPATELRERVGPELAAELLTVYEGGDDWTSHAIDALEPLHELTRRSST